MAVLIENDEGYCRGSRIIERKADDFKAWQLLVLLMLMSCRRRTSRRQDKGIVNFRRKEVSISLFFSEDCSTAQCHVILDFHRKTPEDLKRKRKRSIFKVGRNPGKGLHGNTSDIYNC